MKVVTFVYLVSVVLELTEQEVTFLCDLARAHYDATCRAAEAPGPNAFLNGMRNCLEGGKAEWEWSFRECDIARKILETSNSIVGGGPLGHWRACATLAFELDKTLRGAQQEIARLAKQMNTR
jgi:hypothetical protein